MYETNSNAALDFIKGEVLANLERAKGDGRAMLVSFRDIGRSLHEAKEVIGTEPKGAFGKWCEANFPFSKEWRARLMKLATEWSYVAAAMTWATDKMGRTLGRKEYSVDGALALVVEWIKAAPEEAEALGLGERVKAEEEKAEKARQRKAEKEAAEGEGEGGEGGGKADGEAALLRKALAEALERIRALEAELSKARKGDAKGPEEAPKAAPDKAAQARARKVAELALRGSTKGERDAGRARILDMAAKAGLDVADFLAACGIDVKAYEAAAQADIYAEAA